MLCFRMSGAMLPLLPYMPSWLTEWHIYLYRYKGILCRCELVVRFSEVVWCFTIRDNIDLTNTVMRRIAMCRLLAKGSWEWRWPLWRPTSVIQTYTRWGRWGERTHYSLHAGFKAFRRLVFSIDTSRCVLQCREIFLKQKKIELVLVQELWLTAVHKCRTTWGRHMHMTWQYEGKVYFCVQKGEY
jgi:hypothetical protein